MESYPRNQTLITRTVTVLVIFCCFKLVYNNTKIKQYYVDLGKIITSNYLNSNKNSLKFSYNILKNNKRQWEI